jgi:threonine/homoserine/homoserine lactone efflux protein
MLIMKFSPFGAWGLVTFTVAHWLCDLVWLSFVAVLVYRTKGLWGPRLQEGIFMVCSLALVGFGVWFVVSGVKLVV